MKKVNEDYLEVKEILKSIEVPYDFILINTVLKEALDIKSEDINVEVEYDKYVYLIQYKSIQCSVYVSYVKRELELDEHYDEIHPSSLSITRCM